MKKGQFDLDDLAEQLKQMARMGGMAGVMGMLPGMGKMKKQMDAAELDNSVIKRQGAIISSMTKAERRNPKLLNASRKKRVAAGSGTSVQEINRLLKMHRQMADMMKAMAKGGKRGMGGLAGLFGGGGMPELPADMPADMPSDPKEIEKLLADNGKVPGLPGGLSGLSGAGGFRGGLPGLSGLGGPNFKGKKK